MAKHKKGIWGVVPYGPLYWFCQEIECDILRAIFLRFLEYGTNIAR
jgi:hypothetical protein